MSEGRSKLILSKLRLVMLVFVFGNGYLFFSAPILAAQPQLPPDHGYMLIRVILDSGERVNVLGMSGVDTDQVVRIRSNSFVRAGIKGWIALVAMPKGKYFWSEYESTYEHGSGDAKALNPRFRRTVPDSARDIFQIVPGVVNYIGDWTMYSPSSSHRRRLSRTIEFDKSTLERYLAQYPEHTNRYGIYLSLMGKDAISLVELVQP